MRIRLSIAVTGLALCGCPSEAPPIETFTIELQLDTEGESATCTPQPPDTAPITCNSYFMTCDARVAVRLLDLPPENPGLQPQVRNSLCLKVAGSQTGTLCALGDPAFANRVRFTNVNPERGQIEVTVWRDDQVFDDEGCPVVRYDLDGRPVPEAGTPTPAFGRRVIFDFGGQDPIAMIPLACEDTASVTGAICEPPATYDFEVHADDINGLLLGVSEDKAQFLQVRIGQPTPADDDVPPENFQIIPVETIELGLNGGASPFWKEDEQEIPAEYDFSIEEGNDICAIVTDFGSQPAATCTTVTAEQEARTEPVTVDAFMVSTETWDDIQSAIELDLFPSEGLILGRVVDTNMIPLDGVVITTDTVLPPILWYINETLTGITDGGGVDLTETSTSGYFVAQGPTFRTTWDASRPGTWRVVGTPTGGALNNKTLTVLLIQMTQDFKE